MTFSLARTWLALATALVVAMVDSPWHATVPQALLAALAARRAWLFARGMPVPAMRGLRQTAGTLARLARLTPPSGGWLAAGQGDLVNLFMVAAAVLTLGFALSPPATYPLSAFLVPVVALAARAADEGFPRGGGSPEGAVLAATLAGGAVVLGFRGGSPAWCLVALWFSLFPALAWRRRA
jgi:hypothetical protein